VSDGASWRNHGDPAARSDRVRFDPVPTGNAVISSGPVGVADHPRRPAVTPAVGR